MAKKKDKKRLTGPHTVLLNGYPVSEHQDLSDAYANVSMIKDYPWTNPKDVITIEWNKSMADFD